MLSGLAGLYRGLGITLVRDIPSHGVYFCMYDWVREQLEPGCREAGSQSHAAALVAGQIPAHASNSTYTEMEATSSINIRETVAAWSG